MSVLACLDCRYFKKGTCIKPFHKKTGQVTCGALLGYPRYQPIKRGTSKSKINSDYRDELYQHAANIAEELLVLMKLVDKIK